MSNDDPQYSRRQFLIDVGRVGGYGALYSTMAGLGLLATPANAKPVDFVPL